MLKEVIPDAALEELEKRAKEAEVDSSRTASKLSAFLAGKLAYRSKKIKTTKKRAWKTVERKKRSPKKKTGGKSKTKGGDHERGKRDRGLDRRSSTSSTSSRGRRRGDRDRDGYRGKGKGKPKGSGGRSPRSPRTRRYGSGGKGKYYKDDDEEDEKDVDIPITSTSLSVDGHEEGGMKAPPPLPDAPPAVSSSDDDAPMPPTTADVPVPGAKYAPAPPELVYGDAPPGKLSVMGSMSSMFTGKVKSMGGFGYAMEASDMLNNAMTQSYGKKSKARAKRLGGYKVSKRSKEAHYKAAKSKSKSKKKY